MTVTCASSIPGSRKVASETWPIEAAEHRTDLELCPFWSVCPKAYGYCVVESTRKAQPYST